jgi:hypothetical protein
MHNLTCVGRNLVTFKMSSRQSTRLAVSPLADGSVDPQWLLHVVNGTCDFFHPKTSVLVPYIDLFARLRQNVQYEVCYPRVSNSLLTY